MRRALKGSPKKTKKQIRIEFTLDAIRELGVNPEKVSEIYRKNRHDINSQAPYFATLVALSSGDGEEFRVDLYRRVIGAAIDHKYFDPFLLALIKSPTSADTDELAKKRTKIAADIVEKKLFSDQMKPHAGIRHQSVVDPNRQPSSSSDAEKRYNVRRATAVVRSGTTVLGTGFLVGPDLVITANHVAFNDNGAQQPDLQFVFAGVFYVPLTEAPVFMAKKVVAASKKYLQDESNTGGVTKAANSRLDYALWRLPQSVQHCEPVSYARTLQQPDSNCVLLTYASPGANTLQDAYGKGLATTPHGYRIGHRINTDHGNSGAPILDTYGKVVGLHEAGWPSKAQENQHFFGTATGKFNRAVDFAAILADIKSQTGTPQNPFKPEAKTTPSNVFENKWREEWAVRGWRLAGQDEEAWCQFVRSIGDPDPRDATSPSQSFVPIFRRPLLEDWVKDALKNDTDTQSRLLAIQRKPKQRGAGLSFAANLVALLLDDPKSQLVSLTPGKIPYPWDKALSRERHGADSNRPGDGTIRYQVMESVINDANQPFLGIHPPKRRLVVMDMTGLGDPFDQSLWLALASRLCMANNYRVVLIDPPRDYEAAFARQFASNPQTAKKNIRTMTFDHVDWDDIETAVRGIDPAQLWAATQLKELKQAWEAKDRLYRRLPDLQTVEAVALVINRAKIVKSKS